MANKFQKSVLERLELEQKKGRRKTQDAAINTSDGTVRHKTNDTQFAEDEQKAMVQESITQSPEDLLQSLNSANKDVIEQRNTEEQESRRKTPYEKEIPSPLEGYLRLSPTRQAKNKTFYLDLEVIEAVKAAAKQAGVADSKLVNDILRTVLAL